MPVRESTEIEVKYFILPTLAREITRGREYSRIEQHYFPRKMVGELVTSFDLHQRVEASEDFSSARIRKVAHPSGPSTYYLEFKGTKESIDGAKISRREFGIEIPKALFSQLKEHAVAGSLIKRRYEVRGHFLLGGSSPLVAQIDLVEEAGQPLRKLPREFCTVDVEVTDAHHAKLLRANRHSLEFLKDCVELADTGKMLSTRRLAKRGFDEEQRATLKGIIAAALESKSA